MKKLFCLLIVICCLLTAAGCRKKETPAQHGSGTNSFTGMREGDVGGSYTFGRFEQDNNANNGPEPIEWIVLKNDGKTAMLISKYGLDERYYDNESAYADVTWEDCTLRRWLNQDFLSRAFSADEQARLQTVTVIAEKNPENRTDLGHDTLDRVFLLSISEAQNLLASSGAIRCKPTAYAMTQGVYAFADGGFCQWWLRSPGSYNGNAAVVGRDGVSIQGAGTSVPTIAVRPVIVISLN